MNMFYNALKNKIKAFKTNESGGATMQVAVLFGAVGVAMAVLLVPIINDASENYAFNKAVGIDQTTTATIKNPNASKPAGKTIRRVRKSVLDY